MVHVVSHHRLDVDKYPTETRKFCCMSDNFRFSNNSADLTGPYSGVTLSVALD
jgi:hypothetical protein